MDNRLKLGQPTFFAALLLVVLTVATLYPVTLCQFVNVDDVAYVTGNDHVKQGLNIHNVRWALTTMDVSNWHPLTWLSHMVDVSLYGLNPAGHHASSLMIHLLNVILLFFWLQAVLGKVWRSALVAGLFAVHPLALESVAFVAERKNVLSTLFLILTLFAYAWYVRRPSIRRYLVVVLAFILGLMSKPMLVTVPFALFLLDFWPFCRLSPWQTSSSSDNQGVSASGSETFFRLALEKLPLLLLSGASSLLTLKAQALDHEIKNVSLQSRVANAGLSYGIYLKQMVWPARLAIFYPYRDWGVFSFPVVVSLLLIGALTICATWQIRKRPYFAVGWFWYLGTLVPVIGLVHVGDIAHADRYTYVPLIGIFIALIWGIGDLTAAAPRLRYTFISTSVAALVALAITTARDTSYWRDAITISEHSLAVTGSNPLMERALGETLYADSRVDEAVLHLTRSVQEQPTDVGLYDLGTIKLQRGAMREAVSYFQQALKHPGETRVSAQVHNNLAVIEMQQGMWADAEGDFKQSLALDPDSPRHRVAYGWLLMKQSRYSEAAVQFEDSVSKSPDAMAYFYLGSVLEQEHQLDKATDAYRKTLTLAPGLQQAQARLNAIAAMQH
jgi:Flp pilus assembly protein TadD